MFGSLFPKIWHHPASLADNIGPDGQDAILPQVAMDDSGNIIMVWSQSDGATMQIFKSEYRNGVWHNPTSLSDHISFSGQNSRNSHVAMDNNGNAIIIWENYSIYKIEYRNGSWGSPSSLSGMTTALDQIIYQVFGANLWHPQVAMDNNGNAIIVWFQGHASSDFPWLVSYASYEILKSEYRNGVWTSPASINFDGESSSCLPHVAMDNNGNAIIVWEQSDGTNFQIFKSEYRNGVWTNPANLSDNISPDGQDAFNPRVAMDDNGNAIIAWSQSDGTNWQIFKGEYRNGVWTNPANLSDNISPDGQDVYPYQVASMAMDYHGSAIIVWQQFDGTNWQIYKSEFRRGVWTNPANLSDNISPDGQDASTIVQDSFFGEFWNPQIAMNYNGNAIIVWSQSDGTNYKIFKSEYR